MNPTINKFLVAIVTAIVTLQIQLGDTELSNLSAPQILTVVVAFLGALGVYAIPNTKPTS